MKKRKKRWMILSVFLMTVGIAGCGKNMNKEREGELVFLDQSETDGYNEQVWF